MFGFIYELHLFGQRDTPMKILKRNSGKIITAQMNDEQSRKIPLQKNLHFSVVVS